MVYRVPIAVKQTKQQSNSLLSPRCCTVVARGLVGVSLPSISSAPSPPSRTSPTSLTSYPALTPSPRTSDSSPFSATFPSSSPTLPPQTPRGGTRRWLRRRGGGTCLCLRWGGLPPCTGSPWRWRSDTSMLGMRLLQGRPQSLALRLVGWLVVCSFFVGCLFVVC